jgi:methionyl-tRNA synthetase
MSVGQDSDFSQQQFHARYNAELANNLGNLVNRTLNMTNRFAAGIVPAPVVAEAPETELTALWTKTRDEVLRLNAEFQFHIGLERTFTFVTATNAYIEKRAPWKLGKSAEPADKALLSTSLATMAEALRLAAALFAPVMPGTTQKVFNLLGHTPAAVWQEQLVWGGSLQGNKLGETAILFPKPPAA